MRDYEELVEALRLEADGFLMDDVPDMLMADSLNSAADAIEELSAYAKLYEELTDEGQKTARKLIDAYPKWISVDDALPKNELETYWVYTSVGSQHSCRWTNNRFGLGVSDKWGWSVFDIPQYTVVTHWMPLPSTEGLNET